MIFKIELIKDKMDWKMEKVRGKNSISQAFETSYFSITHEHTSIILYSVRKVSLAKM